MKHALNTPTITAHALGELSATETRLLRMTFHDPISAEMLETECVELRQSARALSSILKNDATNTNRVGLTNAQRERLLALTAEPYPAGKSAPEASPAALSRAPLSMEKILAERKSFDSRPSRFATYLTVGAAAIVVLLLSVVRTKPTPGSASAGGSNGVASGAVGASSVPESMATTHFKIIPPAEPDPAATTLAGTGANSTALPEARVPQGPAIPKPDLAQFKNDIPAPQSPEKAVAKAPEPEPTEAPVIEPKSKKKQKSVRLAAPK
jgi:hypothetical protein